MSALIWLAIVAVWGFVLIPMWLRHHDTVVEQRSAERFSIAMRVLSRRGSGRGEPPAGLAGERLGTARLGPGHHGPLPARGTAMSQPESTGPVDPSPLAPPTESADPSSLTVTSVDADSGPAAGFAAGSTGGSTAGSTAGFGLTADAGPGPVGPAPAGPHATPSHPHGVPIVDGALGGVVRPAGPGRPDDPRAVGVRSGEDRPAPARRVDAERIAVMRLRRQRLFLLLAIVPVSIVLAVVLGGMWIAGQLLVDAGLAGYLVHLRRSVQVERRLAVSRAALDRRIEAELARRKGRPVGSSFAYRERSAEDADAAPTAEELTEEDFEIANAQTIDLGSLMAGHQSVAGAGYSYGHGSDGVEYGPAAASGTAGPGIGVSGGEVAFAGAPAQDVPGLAGPGDGYYLEDEIEAAAVATRTTTRTSVRPGARPSTSRPGRVQLNPPGTHGGLIAPGQPAAASSGAPGTATGAGSVPGAGAGPRPGVGDGASAAPIAASPAGPGAPATPAPQDPDELDQLLRRHAVGS